MGDLGIGELRDLAIVSNYKRFEELPCWQKARELCQAVFELISQGKLSKDYSLKDQIWRSSGSVMDNACPVK